MNRYDVALRRWHVFFWVASALELGLMIGSTVRAVQDPSVVRWGLVVACALGLYVLIGGLIDSGARIAKRRKFQK